MQLLKSISSNKSFLGTMKVVSLLLLVLVTWVSGDTDLAHKQQAVNRLLLHIYDPIPSSFTDLKEAAHNWNPRDHTEHCKDGGTAANKLMDELEQGRLLPRHHWFSLFNTRQREEALMLVDLLFQCKSFESFKNIASYFREKMNEGEFVYALYVAVTHSDLTEGVILPPLYEVTPHMFTNSEVINQAYSAKMTQTDGNFKMSFTGTKKNKEQRVAYFGEDIGINSHHVHWHMENPFWWTDKGLERRVHDRKGELFFWAHHQLTARFNAERLSNHLPVVEELQWDNPIKNGFAPHTTYKYGGEFPSRPDDKVFEDVDGVAKIRDLKIMEERIRDAIAHGYIVADDGEKIELQNIYGINTIGDIIESSMRSPNMQYYGALHNVAHMVLGRQADPHGKFGMPPGVMEHFETATRDPAFFRLHKYMDNIFREHKDTLPPYSEKTLLFDSIEITGLEVSELSTYFEDFEFSLTNALDTAEGIPEVPVNAHVSRLNHEPYNFTINLKAENDGPVTVRVFLCPVFDSNGAQFDINEARWMCIEMDKFWAKVHAGENSILRWSCESSVAIPDRKSFQSLIQEADEAVASGTEFSGLNIRGCGHPDRLLLPKGKKGGMLFRFFVAVTGFDANYDDLAEDDRGGNHAYCGIKGDSFPDTRPMGFPFDRRIEDVLLFYGTPNFSVKMVTIHHKEKH